MCKRCEESIPVVKMYEIWDIPGQIYYSYYEEDDRKIPAYFLSTGDPTRDQIIMYCPFCGRELGKG